MTPGTGQATALVDVFKKVDDCIRGLRKQVNTLRTFDGKTLEEVCPGLNDSLDQFIKEIMTLKEHKKVAKAQVDRSQSENTSAKAGVKPKPGSRDFSFSCKSLALTLISNSQTWLTSAIITHFLSLSLFISFVFYISVTSLTESTMDKATISQEPSDADKTKPVRD